MRRLSEVLLWLVFLVFGVLSVIPGEYWMETGSTMKVENSVHGEDFEIYPTNRIKRNFLGTYSVLVRELHTDEVVSEDRSGIIQYKVGTARPDPIRFYGWWSPGAREIPPGDYTITTCWQIEAFPRVPFVSHKTVCVESLPFIVHPKPETEEGAPE